MATKINLYKEGMAEALVPEEGLLDESRARFLELASSYLTEDGSPRKGVEYRGMRTSGSIVAQGLEELKKQYDTKTIPRQRCLDILQRTPEEFLEGLLMERFSEMESQC